MIVELPFAYEVIGVAPRWRRSRQLVQVDTITVDVPHSLGLEAPVVVEWEEHFANDRINTHLRYAKGKFYAPVRYSDSEGTYFVSSDPVRDVVGFQKDEVDAWLSVLPRGDIGLPSRDALAEWFYTGNYSKNVDMGSGLRKSTWAEERNRACDLAQRLRLINDVFYVECDEPKLFIVRNSIGSQGNAWSSGVSVKDFELEIIRPWECDVFPLRSFEEFEAACAVEPGVRLDSVVSMRLLDQSVFSSDILAMDTKRLAHQINIKLHSFKRWLPPSVVGQLEHIEKIAAHKWEDINSDVLLKSLETIMPHVSSAFDDEFREKVEFAISKLGMRHDSQEVRIDSNAKGLKS
jgi:hypothetical protein